MNKHPFNRIAGAIGFIIVLSLPAASRMWGTEQTNSIALTVSGTVEQPLNLTLFAISQMPRAKLTAREKDGHDAVFEGVALAEILNRAKPTLTKQCCNNAVNAIVVVRATDGYRAVFSLPELDPEFTNDKILLADRREGQPIGVSQGPLRIVVPKDKSHARWVRQVSAMEVFIVGASTNRPAR